MRDQIIALLVVATAVAGLSGGAGAATLDGVTFAAGAEKVEAWDFFEVVITAPVVAGGNPFTEATVTGSFALAGGEATAVAGFADSADGRTFHIRFMPTASGTYTWSATIKEAAGEKTAAGKFAAVEAKRRGVIRVDPKFPWHFIWAGTGEHYFLNGTTAFFLMGWQDDKVIDAIIDRLAANRINRVRALLYGRSDHTWTEPVKPTAAFKMHLEPWVAKQPEDINDPGFDFARFNVAYWQKVERVLRYAREKDVGISLVMDWNDHPTHPAAGSEDERRYYRYAVARLAAFSNVSWDLGDDLSSFRDEKWTHATGMFLFSIDPYHHLATSHPVSNSCQDRTAPWFGMTSFQYWNRPVHDWMLDQRKEQAETKRIIPQVNEEYGYEDHYPDWAPYKKPAASADGNRRAAWEMAMAGTYQTTGESGKHATAAAPDVGGWINGRADEKMTLAGYHRHLAEFFTSYEWWKSEPHDELVTAGAFCLAEPGKTYAIYMEHGAAATVTLEAGKYSASWFNPRTGTWTEIGAVEGGKRVFRAPADKEDWAMLVKAAGKP